MEERIATGKSRVGAIPFTKDQLNYAIMALEAQKNWAKIHFSHENSSGLYKKEYPERVKADLVIWNRIEELSNPILKIMNQLITTLE